MGMFSTSSSRLDLTISMPGFSSSSSGEKGSFVMRDFDINQVPAEEEHEDQWRDEEEVEESFINCGETPRKKLRLSKEQSRLLEDSFRLNHTLNTKQKEMLAKELKLRPRQVEVWFQNRRARSKLKHTEIECEYLKRWFGSLTEQNRRLKREVEELRAIKVGSPNVFNSPNSCERLPASTLTMCPSCQRVTPTSLDNKDPTATTASTLSAVASGSYHP